MHFADKCAVKADICAQWKNSRKKAYPQHYGYAQGKLSGCGFGFSSFLQLVKLLGGQAGLGYHIPFFWEAVVKGVGIADADHIADLIPVVVGIKAVAGQRTLGIVKPSVAAGKMEAVFIVVRTMQLTLPPRL